MEDQKELFDLLDMMVQPVFCVQENFIIRTNTAARQLFLKEGTPIDSLLETGAEDYAQLSEGCLFLTLSLCGQHIGAAVQRIGNLDIFQLTTDNSVLQALALASGQLRSPLNSALAQTASLLETQEDPQTLSQLAQLNQNLYQLLRILGNMSDAYQPTGFSRMETLDIYGLIHEIFEKAQAMASASGRSLSWQIPGSPLYCLADREQLERAILNILSNAMKFTPGNGSIEADVTRHGRNLVLTVQDSGSGIAGDVLHSLFQRHLRQPAVEDSRFGLGLGIRMIHTAAIHHGGTLLISPRPQGGTQVVLRLPIRQKEDGTLRSPLFPIDYAGGFDHSLVELADVLSADLFGEVN